jgi:hypothetical protein
MQTQSKYRLVLGEAPDEVRVPPRNERKVERVTPAKPTISPQAVARALKATEGAQDLIARIPNFGRWQLWFPTATFTVCLKTGTATYLDIWDCDHFDYFTDMQRNLADCRVWFSDKGFTYWDSPETRTGRINCYFRAPTAGNYVCNVELQQCCEA